MSAMMNSQDVFAVDHLYKEHRSTVERYLWSRCSDRATVDDVVAETFLSASLAITAGKQISAGWLITVAKRRLIDNWRLTARSPSWKFSTCDPIVESQERLIDEEQEIVLALGRLPDHYAAALRARYLHDRPVAEVADLLGVGYKAAESLLARARNAFRASLGESDNPHN